MVKKPASSPASAKASAGKPASSKPAVKKAKVQKAASRDSEKVAAPKAPAKPRGKYDSLHERLRGPIRVALKEQLKIENTHALPRIEKVIVNVGINKTKMDSKELHAYIGESLGIITGLKPVYTHTRIAISNFKTRQGLVVGAKVTLRGKRMEEFIDRLLSTALPRIRDFRGLPSRLDGQGNYAIGLKDHSIFPEIAPPEPSKIFGMQIQFSTTAKNDTEAMALLKLIGMPFKPSTKRS